MAKNKVQNHFKKLEDIKIDKRKIRQITINGEKYYLKNSEIWEEKGIKTKVIVFSKNREEKGLTFCQKKYEVPKVRKFDSTTNLEEMGAKGVVSLALYGSNISLMTPTEKFDKDFKKMVGIPDLEKIAKGDKKNPLNIGYDSEWKAIDGFKNIITRQYYIGNYAFVFLPITRHTLQREIDFICDFLISVGYFSDLELKNQKVFINLIAHNTKVDILSSFKNSKSILKKMVNVGGASFTNKSFNSNVYTSKRNKKRSIGIQIYDTMALSVAQDKSLKSLAQVIGTEKLEIGDKIANMDKYFIDDLRGYIEYAINDSVIAYEYFTVLFGGGNVSKTIGSIGAKAFRKKIMEIKKYKNPEQFDLDFRGLKSITIKQEIEVISKKEVKKKLITQKELVPANADTTMLFALANSSYMGGLNIATTSGVFLDELTNDFDIKGCYPSIMGTMFDIDYTKPALIIRNQEMSGLEINPLQVGFGEINFELPEDFKCPCLFIKDEKGRGLVPVRKGTTQATLQEIFVAHRMGAKIFFKTLILPHLKPDRTMGQALKHNLQLRDVAKQLFGDKSDKQALIKGANNSTYGKMGQGLHNKKTWNAKSNDMDYIPPSIITSPPVASYTTGFARAFLCATIFQLQEQGFTVHSATTDGLITNAPLEVIEKLDCFGLTRILSEVRQEIANDNRVWETKHHQETLLNGKTRLNIGINSEGNAGVLAKSSVKLDKNIVDEREFMIDLFINRQGRVESKSIKLQSNKEQILKGYEDEKEITKNLRLDYDFKMQPVKESVKEVDFMGTKVLTFECKLWDTIEDFDRARIAYDNTPLIKSEQHLLDWEYKNEKLKNPTQTRATGGVVKDKIKNILRWLRSGDLLWRYEHLNNLSFPEVQELITEKLGVTISKSDWKNAGRKERLMLKTPIQLIYPELDKLITK